MTRRRGRASAGLPQVSHHRGGTEHAEPGSVAAYEAAVAGGAELIEFDVRRSADGVLFCTHDSRTPDGVRLSDLTWDEILEVRPGTPTYEQLLELSGNTAVCHVDLKDVDYEDEVVRLAEAYLSDVSTQAIFTSLEDQSVLHLRSTHPSYVVALSLGRQMPGHSRAAVLRTRLSELFPYRRIIRCRANAIAAHQRLVTRPLVVFCRLRGIKVMAWTINDDRRLRRFLARRGVDVIVTDRPFRAMELRAAARVAGNPVRSSP